MKRKRWLWLILILAILPFIFFPVFLLYTTAPIVEGNSEFNVAYSSEQSLDFYYPTKAVFQKSPLILFAHGGGWIVGNKESINFNRFNGAVEKLRAKGFALASPSYTLAKNGESPFPQNIKDLLDAIDWLKKNSDSYGIDTNKIGLFGESAGAHLSLMIALHAYADEHPHWSQPKIDYLIDVYGPSKMNDLYLSENVDSLYSYINQLPAILKEPLDIRKNLFGFDPQEDSIQTKKFMDMYSPFRFITEAMPPILIIHGTQDLIVPIKQSRDLKVRLDSFKLNYQYHELEGVNHAFIGATESQEDSIQDWISSFILSHY
jgi:acetyl esterase/lipase